MIKFEYLLVLILVQFSIEQVSSAKFNLKVSKLLATTPSTSSTTPNNSTYIYSPKLFLITIGNYNRETSSTQLSFDMIFKRYRIETIPQIVYITVEITYSSRRLRFLEQETANCPLTTESRDILTYGCTVNNINPEKEVLILSADPNSIKANNINANIFSTSLANQTYVNIVDLKGKPVIEDKNIFEVTNLEKNTFKITGYAQEKIQDKTIVLYAGNQNISCDVEEFQNYLYELNCRPERDINVDLNGVEGKCSNKNILLNFPEELDRNINFTQNTYKKKSSSGLSSGAIAGIIVACVAALIATGIAAALCRNSPKPPMQEVKVDTFNSFNNMKA